VTMLRLMKSWMSCMQSLLAGQLLPPGIYIVIHRSVYPPTVSAKDTLSARFNLYSLSSYIGYYDH